LTSISSEKVTFSGLHPVRENRIKSTPENNSNMPLVDLKNIIITNDVFNLITGLFPVVTINPTPFKGNELADAKQ
jgi:hypothetical protein